MKKKLLLFVLLFSALLLVGCGKDEDEEKSSDSANSVVKAYFKAIIDHDEKGVCKAMHKKVMEELYDDIESCYEKISKSFEMMEEEDIVYKDYEIVKSEELDEEDLEDAKEKIEDSYDIPAKDVKKVVKYEVDVDAKGSENDTTITIYAVKIGSKWSVMG